MTPEELNELRKSAAMVTQIGIHNAEICRHPYNGVNNASFALVNLPGLLAHIDQQAAQIEALKEMLVSMTTTAIWKASYDSLTGKYTISVTASQNGQNVNLPVKTYATVGSVVLGKTTSDTKLNLLGYGEVSLDKVEQIAL